MVQYQISTIYLLNMRLKVLLQKSDGDIITLQPKGKIIVRTIFDITYNPLYKTL